MRLNSYAYIAVKMSNDYKLISWDGIYAAAPGYVECSLLVLHVLATDKNFFKQPASGFCLAKNSFSAVADMHFTKYWGGRVNLGFHHVWPPFVAGNIFCFQFLALYSLIYIQYLKGLENYCYSLLLHVHTYPSIHHSKAFRHRLSAKISNKWVFRCIL